MVRIGFLFELYDKYTAGMFVKEKRSLRMSENNFKAEKKEIESLYFQKSFKLTSKLTPKKKNAS